MQHIVLIGLLAFTFYKSLLLGFAFLSFIISVWIATKDGELKYILNPLFFIISIVLILIKIF